MCYNSFYLNNYRLAEDNLKNKNKGHNTDFTWTEKNIVILKFSRCF